MPPHDNVVGVGGSSTQMIPTRISPCIAVLILVGWNILFVTSFCKLDGPLLLPRRSTTTRVHDNSLLLLGSLPANTIIGNDDNQNNNNDNQEPNVRIRTPELFSVAPMMAHSNRHYHYFFRHISHYATLYTEMIPSAQMVAAYQRDHPGREQKQELSVERVMEDILSSREKNEETYLDALVKIAQHNPTTIEMQREQPIILQLGGRDPHTLALAAAMGTVYGYDGINLNCGCPSNAVSGGGRSGGAALMREPSLVAECVEAMSQAIETAHEIQQQQHQQQQQQQSSSGTRRHKQQQKPALSVKHRLGVHDAATYDADADRQRDDDEAFLHCSTFVRAISLGGDISKVQVHGRLGLLGEFDPAEDDSATNGGGTSQDSLWVPGNTNDDKAAPATKSKKVDHKRLQYRAKQKARQATIQNRSVPPLRPGVAERIAAEFPHLEVITNGGMQSLDDVRQRIPSDSQLIGAMVGRAAINHPCAFGAVDELWEKGASSNQPLPTPKPSREAVLLDYIQYCQREEDAFVTSTLNQGRTPENLLGSLAALRRRLVAVPFQLFAGEAGNEEYQRRIRKLVARAERHSSSGILSAALSVVPSETLLKPVHQHATKVKDIQLFQSAYQRSGPLQRTIA